MLEDSKLLTHLHSTPTLTAILLVSLVLASGPAQADETLPVVLPMTFDVSPDGSTVVYSWMGDLWTVPISGGTATRLTTHSASDHAPRYSRDGKRIAFISTRSPRGQVFVMPAMGGSPVQITHHTDGFKLNGWYPDGSALLVSAARDAYWRYADRFFRVDLQDRVAHEQLFDAFGRDGALSPDANRILFVREGERWWRKGYTGERAAQIWLHDLKTKSHEKLSKDRIPHEWPLWHPDGKGFYYVSEEGGTRNLWTMDLASRDRKQLTHFKDDGVTFPALSADGTVLVFRCLCDLYAYRPGSDEAPEKICIRYQGDELMESVERRMVTRAENVAFTPDGKQMAMVAGGDIFVMDRELREPRRVTDTPEAETEVLFSSDGKALYFISTTGGQPDIWVARPADPKKYWWLNDRFDITRITSDPDMETRLRLRPDGKKLAFLKGGGGLWTLDPDGKNPAQIVKTWDRPRFQWSPDGKWFVYSVEDNDFNSDVWVVKADGSAPPYNITRHPDRDSGPAWSPDGKMIAFTGKRTHDEVDVYYVYLTKEDDQISSRDRKLKKAMEAMKKGARKTKKSTGKTGAKSPPEPEKPNKGKAEKKEKDEKKDEKKNEKKKEKKKDKKPVKVNIDFDGLHHRIHRISIRNSTESGLLWSADSKKLVFNATVKGVRGLYAVEIAGKSRAPKKFSSTTLSGARWLKKPNMVVGLSKGMPATLSASGAARTYSFRVKQTVDLRIRRQVALDAAWRVMRESFYDGGFNGKDWDAIRKKYRVLAPHCLGNEEFTTLVNLMLGELNASHMGFMGGGGMFRRRGMGPAPTNTRSWSPMTVHLGVRWDPTHEGTGLKIRDVIPDSPAAREKSLLRAGEVVLTIDGQEVTPDTNLTTVLNEGTDHDYRLAVRGLDGKERTVTLRATTTFAVRRLLYEKILKDRQKLTDKRSGGTLGYVHISGMNWRSFERFEAELYAIGYGKDGLIIDVRNNGGGNTADHLLTVLCQPDHAITIPRAGGRGYPQDRRVYSSWQKPIVVLCNQNSYSNAEIFSHAIRNLGRGKVVGVQTAGGVISTGGTRVLEDGFIRVPFRAWFLPDGEDMELCGAMPHHIVWPKPGELPAGIDRQLEKAIEVLLADVKVWKAKPEPKLKYARERRAKKAKDL